MSGRARRGSPSGPIAPYVERFVERIRDAEDELEHGIRDRQHRWRSRVHRGRVWFDRELRQAHRRMRQSIPAYVLEGGIRSLLIAPVIYSLLVPLVLLDAWVTLYQLICFPIYGISRVPRRRYFALDRHRLAYLNGIEKLHCTFCSYANGLIAYVREIAARTEQYWCPIKHARTIPAAHGRYPFFFDYGDAEGYRRDLASLRHSLRYSLRRPSLRGAQSDEPSRRHRR